MNSMSARELFEEGRLAAAIQAQRNGLSERPADVDARLFLGELLLYSGEIAEVQTLLNDCPCDLAGMAEFLAGYRLLLDAAAKRQRLSIDTQPLFLLEPPEHLALRVGVLQQLRKRRFVKATDLLDEADAATPWLAGHIDGREFDGVRDGDDLFGPILELFVEDRYVWFPFEQIQRLRIGKIETLRDRLFVPAHLRALSGEEWTVHLPALYPQSHADAEPDIQLGRATDWHAEKNGPILGKGLHMLTFGDEELTLFDFTQWERRA